jgi:predicted DNA-binding WGR domain protein
MKRRFEYVGGSSAKFWEVETDAGTVTVRYGRIGTPGQRQVKIFPVSIAAQNHAEKLVKQKLAKGYVECVLT